MGKSSQSVRCPNCDLFNPEESHFCNHCGFPIKKDLETLTYPDTGEVAPGNLYFAPGNIFAGRYQIIEEIGRGGMGCVYKAQDQELNITVALKMIHLRHSSNQQFIRQFKQETLLGRSIVNENVVRIFDIGQAGEIRFISMEYIKGQSLKDLISASGALSLGTIVHIAVQVCQALASAHKKNVIHCDLKPSNIMIDVNGNVHVADFGIARLMGRDGVAVETIIGTPPYTSPEQALGKPLDQRSDIYNLGCVLYELLAGQRPFSADSMEGYIHKHLEEKPPPPSTLKPDIPVSLEKIVLKCLEKDPPDRYQSCEDIIKDLGSVWPHQELEKYKKRVSLFRWPLFYLALLLCLVAGAYFLFFYVKTERPVASGAAQIGLSVLPFQNNSGDASLDHYQTLFQEMLITDLEQSKYLRVLPSIRLNSLLTRMKHTAGASLSESILDRIAKDEGLRYFILGSYSRFGEELRFTVKIVKPFSYEPVSTKVGQFNQGGDALDKIDELTIWMKTRLGFKRYEIVNDYDERIRSLTGSERALQLYYQGRRCYLESEFENSNKFLMEAVALDPNFAMAYRRISVNYAYLQNLPKAREFGQKAIELANRGRTSIRDKLLIQGYAHYYLEGSAKKAIADYEDILKVYPDDEEAHIGLGAIYRNLGQRDLAELHFQKVLLYLPDLAHANLVWIYLQKGEYTRAIDLLESNKDILSPRVYHSNLASAYFCKGDVEAALQNARKIEQIFPEDYQNIEFLGNVFQIRGDLDTAQKCYLLLLNDHNRIVSSLSCQSFLALQEGRFAECEKNLQHYVEEFKKQGDELNRINFLCLLSQLQCQRDKFQQAKQTMAEVLQELQPLREQQYTRPKIMSRYLSGLALAGLNDITAAEKEAAALKDLIDESMFQNQYVRYYHHLRGMIALQRGEYAAAIDDFNRGYLSLPYQNSPLDEHALFLAALAQANYLNHKLDEARKYRLDILKLTSGRLRWGHTYVKSFYWLGKIAREQGRRRESSEYLRKFLELWENADADLPEITEAKKLLAAL
jgi:tetratricopeptide (TPR) repeat protein